MLKPAEAGARFALSLNGYKVCNKTWRLLLGIGKNRFQRLRSAAIKDLDCPVDERFQPKKHLYLPKGGEIRAAIVEFLQTMYLTVAEPLPEAYAIDAAKSAPNLIRRRGKRPRHLYKHEPANPEGTKGHSADAKFLPPSTIGEILQLCRAEYPHLQIGRKLFCRVSWLLLIDFILFDLIHEGYDLIRFISK